MPAKYWPTQVGRQDTEMVNMLPQRAGYVVTRFVALTNVWRVFCINMNEAHVSVLDNISQTLGRKAVLQHIASCSVGMQFTLQCKWNDEVLSTFTLQVTHRCSGFHRLQSSGRAFGSAIHAMKFPCLHPSAHHHQATSARTCRVQVPPGCIKCLACWVYQLLGLLGKSSESSFSFNS